MKRFRAHCQSLFSQPYFHLHGHTLQQFSGINPLSTHLVPTKHFSFGENEKHFLNSLHPVKKGVSFHTSAVLQKSSPRKKKKNNQVRKKASSTGSTNTVSLLEENEKKMTAKQLESSLSNENLDDIVEDEQMEDEIIVTSEQIRSERQNETEVDSLVKYERELQKIEQGLLDLMKEDSHVNALEHFKLDKAEYIGELFENESEMDLSTFNSSFYIYYMICKYREKYPANRGFHFQPSSMLNNSLPNHKEISMRKNFFSNYGRLSTDGRQDGNFFSGLNGKLSYHQEMYHFDSEMEKLFNNGCEHFTTSLFQANIINRIEVLKERNMKDDALLLIEMALRFVNPKDHSKFYLHILWSKGIVLLELGHYDVSLECLDKILSKCYGKTDHVDNVYYIRTLCLKHLKRYDAALESIENAIEINPIIKTYYYEKAIILFSARRETESLIALDEALKIDPYYMKALLQKGNILSNIGKYSQSIEYYDKVLELDNSQISVHISKGLALYYLDKKSDAMSIFEMFYKEKANDTSNRTINHNFSLLSDLESHRKYIEDMLLSYSANHINPQRKLQTLNDIVQLNPNNCLALSAKAALLTEIYQDFAEAILCFDRLIALDYQVMSTYFSRGVAFMHLKKFNDAISDFDTIARMNATQYKMNRKSLSYVFSQKAQAHLELNQVEDALYASEVAIEYLSDNENALISKGTALTRLRRYQDAVMAANKLLEVNPSSGLAYRIKSAALSNLGKHKFAMEFIEKAIECNPLDMNALTEKGIILANMKQYQEAYACFTSVLHKDPSLSLAHEMRQQMIKEFSPFISFPRY